MRNVLNFFQIVLLIDCCRGVAMMRGTKHPNKINYVNGYRLPFQLEEMDKTLGMKVQMP